MQREDDDAWRAIVDNYGERPSLDDEASPPTRSTQRAAREPEPDEQSEEPADLRDDGADGHLGELSDESRYREPASLSGLDDEAFVPPEPPPLPRPTRDRALAWAGVLGSPVVLLVCLLLSIPLPQLVSYLLVAAFVFGFLYLVFKMPRGPRDPFDDGAVV